MTRHKVISALAPSGAPTPDGAFYLFYQRFTKNCISGEQAPQGRLDNAIYIHTIDTIATIDTIDIIDIIGRSVQNWTVLEQAVC